MKRLSLIVAVLLGALVACSVATAQDNGKDTKKAKKGFTVDQRMERLTKELNLTDDQKPKVKAVLEETSKKMQALTPDERREKGKTIREEETTKLKGILTDEQFKKYQDLAKSMGKKGPQGEKKDDKKTN
jgi:periplasmic protein CpxP/Spy